MCIVQVSRVVLMPYSMSGGASEHDLSSTLSAGTGSCAIGSTWRFFKKL